jgi:hypothetical protein
MEDVLLQIFVVSYVWTHFRLKTNVLLSRSPTLSFSPSLFFNRCVTLWRDREYLDKFKGRLDLIDYAESMNIPVGATKEFSYSEDENMFHISYESGELEDPSYPGHAVEYPGLVLKKKTVGLLDTPDVPARLTIDFHRGNLIFFFFFYFLPLR